MSQRERQSPIHAPWSRSMNCLVSVVRDVTRRPGPAARSARAVEVDGLPEAWVNADKEITSWTG
jgi:hypothetical protein